MQKIIFFSFILVAPLSAMQSDENPSVFESLKKAGVNTGRNLVDTGRNVVDTGKYLIEATPAALIKTKAVCAHVGTIIAESVVDGTAADTTMKVIYYAPFLPAFFMPSKLLTMEKISMPRTMRTITTFSMFAGITAFTHFFSHNYLTARNVDHWENVLSTLGNHYDSEKKALLCNCLKKEKPAQLPIEQVTK